MTESGHSYPWRVTNCAGRWEARRRREEHERVEAEQARAGRLVSRSSAGTWRGSIRAYVAEAQDIVVASRCKLIEDGEHARSLRWAEAYADKGRRDETATTCDSEMVGPSVQRRIR